MDNILRNIGWFMVIFGIGSILINLIGREFMITSWVHMWGPTMAWVIRIAMIVVGGALIVLGARQGDIGE